MKVSIETIESANYGDHAERLRKSHAQVEGETLEDLVRRVFPDLTGARYRQHDPTDEIVLRVVVEPDGTPSGQGDAPSESPF